MDAKLLFDAVRKVKGSALTQADVDLINRALMGEVTQAVSGMRASQRCRDLIHEFEQWRSHAYPDPGPTGKPVTCGWGSTRDLDNNPIKLGDVWTREYSDAVFEKNLREIEIGVNMLLAGSPTTQSQFDAMVSFAYNVGLDIDDDDVAEGLGDSTLLKRHKAGLYDQAKAQFALWNKAKGKVLNGLVRRRAAEAELYAS